MSQEQEDLIELVHLATRTAARRTGVSLEAPATLDGLRAAAFAAARRAHEEAYLAGLCRDGAREVALDAATGVAEEHLAALGGERR